MFHLALVYHVACHFSSGKQVERLHFQYGFLKNEWTVLLNRVATGLQGNCPIKLLSSL